MIGMTEADLRHASEWASLVPDPEHITDEDDDTRMAQDVLGSVQSSQPTLQRRANDHIARRNVLPISGGPSASIFASHGYPIPASRFVQRATQFYIKHYSPAATQRPHYIGVGQDLMLLKDYIPYILSDKMLFCAMVAMSSTAINLAVSGSRERSPESLKFYEHAISLMTQRLSTEGGHSSDAVIIALSSLCGFEALTKNYESLDMHTKAIQHVVTLRGGLDHLGFDGFLKTIAVGWTTFYTCRRLNLLEDEELFPKDGKFTYPSHPFDPGLCEKISKFPGGLIEICLSGVASHQIIVLVGRVNEWATNVDVALREADLCTLQTISPNSRNVTICGEFLHRKNISLIEQLYALALMAFCYSLDATRAMFWVTNAFLQIHCRYLMSFHVKVTDSNQAHLTWVATMLVASFEPETQASMLGLSILDSRPNHRDWRANVRICEQYFWNDALSLRLASKLRHLPRRKALESASNPAELSSAN